VRANENRSETPALLRGLIFGPDGRALSPSHTRKHGKVYRYYVSQAVLSHHDTCRRRLAYLQCPAQHPAKIHSPNPA
jgi:hypothetical protein